MLINFLMNKLRTVIFGGSFDPIHIGHVSLAGEVLRCGLADEVWFMVSPQNPFKQGSGLSCEERRLDMVRLAIDGHEGFVASDFEFSLPRPSYTLNTLDALSASFPDREFILLVGADNWEKFDNWYKSDEILSRYRIIVYPRGNEEQPPLPCNVQWLPSPLFDVSSTMVRDIVSQGGCVDGYVHPEVARYIYRNNLYSKRK